MFQTVTIWNLVDGEQTTLPDVGEITLRGYNRDTFLTGQFAVGLRDRTFKSLSVSDIADQYCPSRRDLYLEKGVNRPMPRARDKRYWGRRAGIFAEEYIKNLFSSPMIDGTERSIANIRNRVDQIAEEFTSRSAVAIRDLNGSEAESYGTESGDTMWLLKLLRVNGIFELSIKLLQRSIGGAGQVQERDFEFGKELEPRTNQIGISSPSRPDFLVRRFKMLGDIKTGTGFQANYLLTCAGYALAHESAGGNENANINWGLIYFLPTRIPGTPVKTLTGAQIYLFPIDDVLRSRFIEARDSSYRLISSPTLPDFPDRETRERCKSCKYRDYNLRNGLDLGEAFA